MSTQPEDTLLCPVCKNNLEFLALRAENVKEFVTEAEIQSLYELVTEIGSKFDDEKLDA